ncbi:DegT/DnrJ/EryC1/StrS family aminotransferase [Paucibacter sp. DJ1R-11]|uniref:DegT/DnrJ/EryC1/StrS family aminotransferase n=1 Tax=Paucibacter sp. DJ1R-11 TaxID=2893556 RepID=UPI0021E45317|nr:DegT/DnrJ/EryC1/StrS family aminotransferase [Paucibacter sp. DJ1R-11]MCV2364570.1 DegT/DnrJ/EryC1/StrS family aminotransferase [Paucibacter sp. DJ1R-11]
MNQAPTPGLRRLRFDASPCNFPRAAVPMLAQPELACLQWQVNPRLAMSPWGTESFKRGRYALHEAMRRSGLGPGTALLAPSYHCLTMLDPALRLGAAIKLFPVNANLTPDIGALKNIVHHQHGDQRIQALLIPHYFGIAQSLENMLELKQICLDAKISLIEDCAHILTLGPQHPAPDAGIHGDWIVSSPYKFFPITEGGLLWSSQHDHANASSETHTPSTGPRWREILVLWQHIFGIKTLRTRSTNRADFLPNFSQAHEWEEACDSASPYYKPNDELTQESILASRLIRHTNIQALQARRRENFINWLEVCKTLRQATPLHTELPAGTIPYMFPLLLKDFKTHFDTLKRAGLPLGRWDNMVDSNCPTAKHYRMSLVHLPCHQSISKSQWTWMASTLRQILEK